MAVPRMALAASVVTLVILVRQTSALRLQHQEQQEDQQELELEMEEQQGKNKTDVWPKFPVWIDEVRNVAALMRSTVSTRSHNQWESTDEFLRFSGKPKKELLDMSNALACLRQTTPHLDGLHYPLDAEHHVREIRDALAPWREQFVGSYHVEDMWNLGFADAWFNRTDKSAKLWQFFGPYIPIFIQWVHPWLMNPNRMWYPNGMVAAFKKVIRKDVLYVAVSQNDEGIVGHNEFSLKDFPNIMVFSAGGYGHIPVPLINSGARSFPLAKYIFQQPRVLQRKRVPVPGRRFFVSYVGSLTHAPNDLRGRMKDTVDSWSQENNYTDKVVFFHEGKHNHTWQQIMLTTRFTLIPRGYGRTAYHLMETIQRGLIPIYIYDDVPWIPYPKVYETMGFASTVEELPALLDRLKAMSDEEVQALEDTIVKRVDTHFTADTMMQHMKNFLTGDRTDLVCGKLPKTIAGQGKWGT